MSKEKTNSFRGKVTKDGERSDRNFESYLNLPKGIKEFKAEAEERKIKLDFLPYVVSDPNHPCKDIANKVALEGDLWYRRPIKMHTRVGGLGNSKILCPKSIGKKCPICDYQKSLFDKGAPKEETTPLYPQNRSLYIVIPEGEDDIYVWDMSNKMFQDVLIEELKDNPDNEVFPALEEGKTLEIRLKWKTIGEKGKPFPEATAISFYDRDPFKESILDEVPDLDKILVVKSYDEIKNLFFELDEEPVGGVLKEVGDEEPATITSRERHRQKEERKVEKEKEPEPEPEKSSRRSRKEKEEEASPAKKDKDNFCPHGLTAGHDFEKSEPSEICDKCVKWDDCYTLHKQLKKDGKLNK